MSNTEVKSLSCEECVAKFMDPIVKKNQKSRIRFSGIQDREDDDIKLWKTLETLGHTIGPQLFMVSKTVDTPDILRCKRQMWDSSLGQDQSIQVYECFLDKSNFDVVYKFIQSLFTFHLHDREINLIITSPVAPRTLIEIYRAVEEAEKTLCLWVYTGEYNLKGMLDDISYLAMKGVKIIDFNRYLCFNQQKTCLDNLWGVHQAYPDFCSHGLVDGKENEFQRVSHEFRSYFNLELIRPDKVFETQPDSDLLETVKQMWMNVKQSGPETFQSCLSKYTSFLLTDMFKDYVKTKKISTLQGLEKDAPIADTIIAFFIYLREYYPNEYDLVEGEFVYNGKFSSIQPSEKSEGKCQMYRMKNMSKNIQELFVGMLAKASE